MLKPLAAEEAPIWSAQQWKDWRDQLREETPILLEAFDNHSRVHKNVQDRKFIRQLVRKVSAS